MAKSKKVPTKETKDNKFTSMPYIIDDNIKSIIREDNKYDITKYYVRTWIDRRKKPYKYEFRGEYAAYHNPNQLIITYKD